MSSSDFDLRLYAHSLPQPEPSAALFERVVHANGRRRKRRKAMLAVFSMLAIVAVAGIWTPHRTAPNPGVAQHVVSAADAREVRKMDRTLQAAYERGADDAELAALWARRDALHRGADAPVPMKL